MPEKICPEHGPFECGEIVLFGRKLMEWPCPKCAEEYEKRWEERKAQEAARQRAEREAENKKVAAIPPRYKGKTLAAYCAMSPEQKGVLSVMYAYADRFEEILRTGAGLVLCGNAGTGKTHLACAVAQELLDKGYSALYRLTIDILSTVKATWDKDSEVKETDAIRLYTKADLLVLDEVGVQFGSDAEKQIMFRILNERYNGQKPTIVISNETHAGLVHYLGARVMDRLTEGGGTIIPFTWKSYRSNV